jgi:hypothetical protein
VAAYHAVLPLSAPEQEIVTDLMVTRQLVTALISEWRAVRYPQNRAYIMRHNPAAWEALARWPTCRARTHVTACFPTSDTGALHEHDHHHRPHHGQRLHSRPRRRRPRDRALIERRNALLGLSPDV